MDPLSDLGHTCPQTLRHALYSGLPVPVLREHPTYT